MVLDAASTPSATPSRLSVNKQDSVSVIGLFASPTKQKELVDRLLSIEWKDHRSAMKILIAEDADGTTRVSYNSPAYLGARYGLTPDLVVNIAVIEQLGKTLIG